VSALFIVPIVEGHGEVAAVPLLLRRIGGELLDTTIHVGTPIRIPRTRMVKDQHIEKAIGLAMLKLRTHTDGHTAILILLDGDGEPPCQLGPEMQQMTARIRPDADIACVVAHLEYETWFVAAADSLVKHGKLALAAGEEAPRDPEGQRLRKAWVDKHIAHQPGGYSETIDQPRFTSLMDLHECRTRSPSFDKLCRELERRSASVHSSPARTP
jgi:hypothetical protein